VCVMKMSSKYTVLMEPQKIANSVEFSRIGGGVKITKIERRV
jgi:hypothetical protein